MDVYNLMIVLFSFQVDSICFIYFLVTGDSQFCIYMTKFQLAIHLQPDLNDLIISYIICVLLCILSALYSFSIYSFVLMKLSMYM